MLLQNFINKARTLFHVPSIAPSTGAAHTEIGLRRALVCADSAASAVMAAVEQQLVSAGYVTLTTFSDDASTMHAAVEFTPDIILIQLGSDSGENSAGIRLARHLRAEQATQQLPLVLLYRNDSAAQRSAASKVGADDYFAVTTPPSEMHARLDALLWRAAANNYASTTQMAVATDQSDGATPAHMDKAPNQSSDLATGSTDLLSLSQSWPLSTSPLRQQSSSTPSTKTSTSKRRRSGKANSESSAGQKPDTTPVVETERTTQMIHSVKATSVKVSANTPPSARPLAEPPQAASDISDVTPLHLLLTVSDAKRMVSINSLMRTAGYTARPVFDGQQALDLLRLERPQLLLLDYELSGFDGIEMLRRLRRQCGGRLTLPVVLLLPHSCAEQHDSLRNEAFALGVDSIISVPYDPAELLECVRRIESVG